MENRKKNISSSCAGVTSENLSELDSEAFSSDVTTASNFSSRSTIQSGHHRYCNVFMKQECTCEFVMEVEKRHIRQQFEKSLQISNSSQQSAILAGHLNVSSQQSSNASYHSAQSASTQTLHDRFSVETCASASDILNEDINSAYEPSSANETEGAALDLNKIQNLFSQESDFDVPENEKELSFNGTQKYPNLHRLLRRISVGTLDQTTDSETSQEILSNLSRSYAQDPENFTRRLVTILEETELSMTLKQMLENYDSEINVSNATMPTTMETTITPPDMILYRSGPNELILKTPKTPNKRSCVDISINNIVKGGGKFQPSLLKQNTSMPTTTEAIITPPDMILYRSGPNESILKTPRTPNKRSCINTSIDNIVKGKFPLAQSPGNLASLETPGSTCRHNDSTFTALEKACGITTPGKFSFYSPERQVKERLEKIVSEQEKHLAKDSPIKKFNQSTISPTTAKSIERDFPHMDGDSDLPMSDGEEEMANLSAGIMEEFEKKLQRCFETHRTIQEIDTESAEASALEETKSSGMTSFLNLLTHVPDYQRYLKSDEIKRAVRNREDSGVDIRSISQSQRSKCRDLLKSPIDPKSLEIKVKLNVNNTTMRKLTTHSNLNRSKSPTLQTFKTVKSKSANRHLNVLTPRSHQISPAKLRVHSSPRAVSPELLSRQRKCSTPRNPHVKISGYQTPQSRTRMPVLTPRKTPRPVSTAIPKIMLNQASAVQHPAKHSEFNLKSGNTPKEKSRAKYFPTPGRTPLLKVQHTPKVFFAPKTTDAGPSSSSPGLHEWYGLPRVKSPVAAYIHGTDNTLVTKLLSKTNDRLLTPTNSKNSAETLNVNSAKQRVISNENTPDNDNRRQLSRAQSEQVIRMKDLSRK